MYTPIASLTRQATADLATSALPARPSAPSPGRRPGACASGCAAR
jgi:hypothetical protein